MRVILDSHKKNINTLSTIKYNICNFNAPSFNILQAKNSFGIPTEACKWRWILSAWRWTIRIFLPATYSKHFVSQSAEQGLKGSCSFTFTVLRPEAMHNSLQEPAVSRLWRNNAVQTNFWNCSKTRHQHPVIWVQKMWSVDSKARWNGSSVIAPAVWKGRK